LANNSHTYNIEKILKSNAITNRQREAFEKLDKYKTVIETSIQMNIRKRTLQEILSKGNKRVLQEEIDNKVSNGQILSGTSTLYKTNVDTGEQEEVLQWVKTKKDQDEILHSIKELSKDFASAITPKINITNKPEMTNESLLVTYITTDLHLGQYAWSEEAGTDVDVDIVEKNTLSAMKLLIDTTPSAKEAIVLDLGDTLHASNDAARTKSGHELDTDSRHARVFKTLVNLKINMIDLALEKHETVKYVIVAGNHSELVPNYLIAMLSAYYKNEPRFNVDESVSLHKYHKHGKTLLGFHHGHSTKMQRLPEVMVWDRKDDISFTTYRYWLTGHLHKDSVLDSPIARCESFRNNTNNDAWATGAGFRGLKQSTAITYHKDYGEISRNIVPIELVKKNNMV